VDSSFGEELQIEVAEGVALLRLNRPGQINAINDAIRAGVPKALSWFEQRSDVRAVVVCGNGERGFCAGADIKEVRAPETTLESRARVFRSNWIEAFDHFSKPVIAAIHGVCMGGGLELALACDIRVASRDAVFALPEVGLGLIPGGGGTQRLVRVVGMGRALDIILSGERFGAEEAHRIGVVSRLFEPGRKVIEDAVALARQIAAKPSFACAMAKEAVRSGADMTLQHGLRLERDLFVLTMATDDRHEAAEAFREKRQPKFRGA